VQATRGSLKKASLGSNVKGGAKLEEVAGVFADIMNTATNDEDLEKMFFKTVMKHTNGKCRGWGGGKGGQKMETSKMAADHVDKFLNKARKMVKEGKGKNDIGIQAANCAYLFIWGEKPKGKLCNALSDNTRTQLASVVSSLLKQEQMRKPVINFH
jgi:hypothetical protein